VEPGDHVVTCLSGFCGQCEQCLGGHPNVCTANATSRPRGATPRMSQSDGRLTAFVGIGSFAEKMLVHEHSLVRIDPELPLDVACLVGCGVLTGVGAALRTAQVAVGDRVAVFGCGGVGLSIVQGAALAGASQIIAVDRVAAKLDLARSLGATDAVDGSAHDAVAAVRELTGGRGVDHAFEAVGIPALVRQAAESLAVRGTCTIVGVPPDGTVFEIPYAAIRPECTVQTCRMGSNRFRTDIPRYLELYRNGRLRLDELVTTRGRLEDVNDAFAAMVAGDGARTVLLFD
jgi:S-(hydroxymethyl)glutathione dehydrogenase/alcohol dehydrogenase